MPFTTFWDQSVIQLLFGDTSYSIPGTLYFGLSSTTPTVTGTNVTEPSGNGYARVAVTNNNTNFVAAGSQPGTGYEQVNGTAIQWPMSTGTWLAGATLTYLVVYDASSSGNLLAFAALSPTLAVSASGTVVTINGSGLTATLT